MLICSSQTTICSSTLDRGWRLAVLHIPLQPLLLAATATKTHSADTLAPLLAKGSPLRCLLKHPVMSMLLQPLQPSLASATPCIPAADCNGMLMLFFSCSIIACTEGLASYVLVAACGTGSTDLESCSFMQGADWSPFMLDSNTNHIYVSVDGAEQLRTLPKVTPLLPASPLPQLFVESSSVLIQPVSTLCALCSGRRAATATCRGHL